MKEVRSDEEPGKQELIFYTINLRKAAMVIRALNHDLRMELLRLIHKKGKVPVTDLFIELRLEQSVASQHLAILRHAGVVKIERKGKFRLYSLNMERLKEIDDTAKLLCASIDEDWE